MDVKIIAVIIIELPDMHNSLEMPRPEPSGFIKTLNKMGYMTSTLDRFSQKVVEFASSLSSPGPFLEIGAAYGVASLIALEKGAHVIANDMDIRHLEILESKANAGDRDRLKLYPGRFPDDLDFAPNSLGSVLICRVLHFFKGPVIEKSIEKLFRWMAPQGMLAIIAETPYLRNLQSFIPTYEKRKKSGEKWPGFIEDIMRIAPERGKDLPKYIHALDPEVLRRVVEEAGFIVEEASTFARPEFPDDLKFDGRESVGIIARKI